MAIRKGKLQKPCRVCGKYFEPNSRGNKMCKKCKPKSYLDIFYERQKRLDKLKKKNGKTN